MNASDMSSGLTKTSSWSVVCLPPNSSLCSESLLFLVAMMGNGVSEELSSPKSVLLEGAVGEESSQIHRSLARASSELYTHSHAPEHGLGFRVPPQHDHGDPAAGRND
jgi:hypothetical protein